MTQNMLEDHNRGVNFPFQYAYIYFYLGGTIYGAHGVIQPQNLGIASGGFRGSMRC